MTTATLRTFDDLPGPKGLPLLGNAGQIQPSRLHQNLEDWIAEYGEAVALRIGRQKVIAISDPELGMEALKDRPDAFRRLKGIQEIAEELGLFGLFSSEGVDWKRQRRAWMQALSIHQVKPFFAQLQQVTERLRLRWDKAAASGEAVDVQADLMRYTVDITTLFSFGVDLNTLEQEGDLIQEHLGQMFHMLNKRIAAPFPYWRWIKLPADRKLDQSLVVIREFVNKLIAEARQRIEDDPALQESPKNLLEALIVARDEDGSAFSDEEIFGNTLTALLAGEDTTANTLAWMIHLLTQNPEVQAELQEQVDTALGNENAWVDLSKSDQLSYIDALMNESFRLKPVAPVIFLCANEDYVLGDLAIEKGTDLILVLRPAALDSANYADPHRFDPNRWQKDLKRFVVKPPMPFGGGPRLCPGRNLAQMEIKAVTAMLARNFKVEAVAEKPVTELMAFTLMPENLRVRFRKRNP